VLDTIVMANTACTAFALALFFRDRSNGAPWLVAAGFMTLQSVTMWTAPTIGIVGTLFEAYTRIPHWIGLIAAVAAGAAAGWLGWTAAPRRSVRRPTTAAADAA
jgi:hypothetical protein